MKYKSTPFWSVINIKNKQLIISFGEHLRSVRKNAGLSQRELAYTADVPISQISRIERGELNVTISTVYALSKALNLEIQDLFDFEIEAQE